MAALLHLGLWPCQGPSGVSVLPHGTGVLFDPSLQGFPRLQPRAAAGKT